MHLKKRNMRAAGTSRATSTDEAATSRTELCAPLKGCREEFLTLIDEVRAPTGWLEGAVGRCKCFRRCCKSSVAWSSRAFVTCISGWELACTALGLFSFRPGERVITQGNQRKAWVSVRLPATEGGALVHHLLRRLRGAHAGRRGARAAGLGAPPGRPLRGALAAARGEERRQRGERGCRERRHGVPGLRRPGDARHLRDAHPQRRLGLWRPGASARCDALQHGV